MIKLTVVYSHPTDILTFENYYMNTHLTKAAKITGHQKLELTNFLSGPDGAKPNFYRMTEFCYHNSEAMQKA